MTRKPAAAAEPRRAAPAHHAVPEKSADTPSPRAERRRVAQELRIRAMDGYWTAEAEGEFVVPSYRVVLTIGRVHPGADAQAVLPQAADAAGRLAVVEAQNVGVVNGRGQATVRFEAPDDQTARPVAAAAAAAASSQAEILEVQLRRQAGTRWTPVR